MARARRAWKGARLWNAPTIIGVILRSEFPGLVTHDGPAVALFSIRRHRRRNPHAVIDAIGARAGRGIYASVTLSSRGQV